MYDNAFLGEIILFAGNFEPTNWAFCDGRLLNLNQNTALFSILGITYGGDGQRTFALPDLREKQPIPGMNYIICISGIYPSRS